MAKNKNTKMGVNQKFNAEFAEEADAASTNAAAKRAGRTAERNNNK
ncbi:MULTISPECIES: hypothetical protein [unclassified Paenibacillus]|nr:MULTISPECIES: hypothetical protein [unclassified Paenibacillus]MBU5442775.1 hypothetical protein [Paenibacillus sp. MSJ-34]CAH0117849.1 hypothetical protein PAE9249_00310 [Paenibacillus sp. CECT 9249]